MGSENNVIKKEKDVELENKLASWFFKKMLFFSVSSPPQILHRWWKPAKKFSLMRTMNLQLLHLRRGWRI